MRRILAFALVVLLPMTTSCYTYHAFQEGGPDGRELGNQAATEWKERTLHAFAWGKLGIRHDFPVKQCRVGPDWNGGFEEVRVRTTFFYALVTVVTLGIYSPLKIGYRCTKPCSPGGTLDRGRR